MKKIYFDYNSTSPLDKRVAKKMNDFSVTNYANPSAIYNIAQEARNVIENARISVSKLLNVEAKEIFFTSGGTEANNLAIKGFCLANASRGNHVITSKIEHASVLNVCRFLEQTGFNVTYLDVDNYGMVDVRQLERAIDKKTVLVSIMHANNEIGTIQPIEEIGAICGKYKVCFHVDAVQTFGKMVLDPKHSNIDIMSISAHKIYGPKGTGALYVREGIAIIPLFHGGHQENDLRPGTENIYSILGFGETCRLRQLEIRNDAAKVRKIRDILEKGILKSIQGVKVNGHPKKRLYNTLNICIEGVEAQNVVINLDMNGFCVSSGSACQAKVFEPSYVLLATGLSSRQCSGALRFSLGRFTRKEEVRSLLKVLPGIIKKLRESSSHG